MVGYRRGEATSMVEIFSLVGLANREAVITNEKVL